MKKELYDVQLKHAAVLATALQKHDAALDGSSTGTGKTLVGVEIAKHHAGPVLVICLKSSIPMWKEELAAKGVETLGAINYELLRRGKTEWGRWVGHNLWGWNLPKDTLIIHDECQRYQGVASQNSRMLIAAKPYKNLLLSATAAESPVDMRASGYILGLHNLAGFWRWCKQRGCSPNQWGGLDFNGDEGVMQALHEEIFPEHGSRMTVEDLKEHFQETQIITTPIDFGDKIAAIYEAMEAELAELAEVMTSDSRHPAAERLVAQLRARQKTELLKVPVIIELTLDLLKEGRSVAIFVNFDATIEAMKDRFGVAVAIVRGGQKEDKLFQSNERRVALCNLQTGGVSINLHDEHGGHPRASIISPSFNAKDTIQAMGRIHRAGGKTPSQQKVLFASGTVEVTVEKAVREKMRSISIFNDGIS